jgi:energy-coupling factor transporter ATP-binding protein EcfA2
MPYPGLRPFDISAERDESVIFFGRKKQVYELIDRLATSNFIAVLGPSGCGKSSLIRAGVIPNLKKGYLDRAGARWTSIMMEPGGQPVRALATGLHNALVEAASGGKVPDLFTTDEIEQRLNRRPDALVTFFEEQESVSAFDPESNILILVDQFEEIFRQDMTAEPDAQHFINLIMNVYHDPPKRLYIILAMRTDFIKQSACYPGLPTVLSRTMCLIDKIDKLGLREAITEPVKLKFYQGEISEDLTKEILKQMDSEGPYDPDLLPLMQHALLWGWQKTLHKTQPETDEKTVLRLEDFSAFTDLADCLSKHADAIFNGLTDEQQRIAEIMFRLLCDVTPDGTKIRRVTSVDEIVAVAACRNSEDVRTVIDAFMSNGAGFIRWKDEGKKLDVSHESFIRKWNRFNVWADREAKKAKKYIELQSRAYHRQETGLLNRLQCEYYSNWGKETKPTGAWAKRYRYLPIIKKEYCSLVSESKIEIDYLDVQAYLEDSKHAFTRTYLMIFIFIVVLMILSFIALLFCSSMKSLEAEDHLKKAEEILSKRRAIDENQYKSNLKEMIKNAELSLK